MNNDNQNKAQENKVAIDDHKLEETAIETSTGPDDIIDTDVDDEETANDKIQNKLQ